MPQFKLVYFDFNGGRGEPARLAMHICDIEFEDFRFTFEQFTEVKKTTPLGQVPTLFIDGKQITQGNGINRYIGKIAGLYPENLMQALLCDEIMGALEDVTNKLVGTFGLEGDALKQAREELSAGPIMQYLEWVADRLAEQGGKYFVGGTLSMADLKVFSWVKDLNSGRLDHISNLLVKEVAPTLQAHCDRVAQLPKIASYYASQQV